MVPVLKTFKLIVLIKTLLGAVEVRMHCMSVTEPAILGAQIIHVYTV